ncbi:major facilitator superfamily MFS_1 [Kribbella flavida DSM 17836]|uniref:Major facilitator superfamily MFS_1 n=1 Tax=Kribbella flavida (strain DSM 17836 / JCM 10339 / NBRC 14399) TaxID=479435 RepID=D2PWM5_KRIFD|nr:MFS transporter [Kribbella flavida]ADB33494.1 major facilitator superfamily MFS_1 [Kribbella flavida DSM 17836]
MTATTLAPGRVSAPTRLARGTVLAAASLTLMAAAIISPSLPVMREVFAGTAGADLLVRLALTVTSLAIAISAPLSGIIADRIGRRPLLVWSLVLYAVTGTAGFFVNDLYLLLVTRAGLGLAVGGVMTAVSATIIDWYAGPRRAAFLGLQQAAASLGGVVFLPLAGVLSAVNWKAPFWIYSLSAIVALAAVLGLREPHRPAPASTRGAPSDLPRGRVFGIYALALAATLVFYMAPTQLPFLLGEFGSGPAAIGTVVAGSTLTSVAGALAFRRVRQRLSPTAITTLALALLGVGWVLVGTAGSLTQVVAGLLVGGLGVGFVVPNLNLRLSEFAGPAQRGQVLSGLVAGIFLGQFLSPLAVQPLIQTTGIAAAFTWTGVALTAGAALAAIRSRTTKVSTRKESR